MKNASLVFLIILSNSVFGQIPGKANGGPVVLFDTLTIKAGDIILLGKGSDPATGDFIHLYAPKRKGVNTLYTILANNPDFSQKLIPQKNLERNFAGSQLVVESFSIVTSKKGKVILGVVNMKNDQFTEGKVMVQGVFLNDVVVDFKPAFRSGEIIKISAPVLTEKAPEAKKLFIPFEMTPKGIAPVVVTINNLSKKELYNKTLHWTNSYYPSQNQATITSAPDEKININNVAKNVKFGRFMEQDIFAYVPYLFTIDFTDGEITMTFTLGGENGDIMDADGEVTANISPSRMFEKNGEVRKMGTVLKVDSERMMNEVSYALVNYLMN